MENNSFYTKINQVAFKDVVDFLVHNNTEISLKVFGNYFKTNIISKIDEKQFGIPKFSVSDFSNEPVICIFQIEDDRYFFSSLLTNHGSVFGIDVPTEIFQLQRRNDYRVPIPIGVVYKCKILAINEVKNLLSVEVRDLSLGGCLISIPGMSIELKSGDKVELFLQLDKFEFQKLQINVKHVKFNDAQNTTSVGAAFFDPESEVRSQLLGLLMHLDRVKRRKPD